jgi:hypothetical protein
VRRAACSRDPRTAVFRCLAEVNVMSELRIAKSRPTRRRRHSSSAASCRGEEQDVYHALKF